MIKMRKLEDQIQEITFFLSVITAFSLFISGIFYLTLNLESLTYIMGQFGVVIQEQFFTLFGYAFFYLAIVALHMGYIANFHIYSFKDIKREYPVLIYSGIAHLIILSLFASSLSVIQIYLDMPSRESMAYGAGGLAGLTLGGSLYQVIGVYGSIIILAIVALVTAILADFFEFRQFLDIIQYFSKASARSTVSGLKSFNNGMTNGFNFLLKSNEFPVTSTTSTAATKNWISRANTIITDHFHIYEGHSLKKKTDAKKEESTKNIQNSKKATKKKVKAAKKTSKKTTRKKATKRKSKSKQSKAIKK